MYNFRTFYRLQLNEGRNLINKSKSGYHVSLLLEVLIFHRYHVTAHSQGLHHLRHDYKNKMKRLVLAQLDLK